MSYQSAVMADSPAALWMLNETSGTIAHDSTGHGNDLTYVGTYTLGSPGVIHSDTSLPALGLTGVDTSGATLSTSSVISNNTVWTLEACIKTGSLPPANDWGSVIYCGNDQSPGGWGFGVGAPNDTPGGTNLVVLFGRVAWYDSGYSLSSDSDYHIVVTFNSPTLTFYVNGVQVSQLSASNPNNPAPNLYLGYETNTNINRGYNGTIQAVALYSTALTGTQVANHYSAYTPPGGILAKRRKSWGRIAPPVGTQINWSHPLARGLNFCWVAEGSTPNVLAPERVRNILGTGVVSGASTQPVIPNRTPLSIGYLWDDTGSSSGATFIGTKETTLFGPPFTVLSWVDYQRNDAGGGQTIITTEDASGNAGWDFSIANGGPGGNMAIGVSNRGSITGPLTPSGLHMVGVTIDASASYATFYIDLDTTVATNTFGASWLTPIADTMVGGKPSSGYSMKGCVSSVYLWNRVLLPSEIEQIYRSPQEVFIPPISPLSYFSVPNLDIPNETTGGVW